MKRFIFLLFITYSLLYAVPALAAKLELVSSISEIGVGQEFQVDLILDAEGEDINAAQGKIIFSENLLELKNSNDGNSVITFWIQKPVYVEGKGIEFSGVIPGGFSGVLGPYYKGGKPGKILSLVLKTKNEGNGSVEIKDAKVLLNDGKGTEADAKISGLQFQVSNLIPSTKYQILDSKDTDPPELFTREVSRDPNVFEGKWFLVFAAQDKVSGIDRYGEQETWSREPDRNKWQTVESPFVLKDQSRTSYIFVKAIDRAGNERIVVVTQKFAPWYKKPIVDMILTLVAFVVLILMARWLWRLYTKQH